MLRAKDVLEAAIDAPVILYSAPGNNTNMADHVLKACRTYGYLGAMSLTDALTFDADVPAPWCYAPKVWIDNAPHPATLVAPGKLRITAEVENGMKIAFQSTIT